jgi:aqualysin 1
MRIPSRLRLVALGTLAAAAACADPVAPPATPDAAPSLARSASAGSGQPIPDQYIVVFDDAVRDVPGLARGLAGAHGATVRFEYEHALKGFAGRMSAQAAEAIARNPNVAYVEQDQEMTVGTTQSPATWGLDRIDQRDLPLSNSYTYEATGAGVTAYIIDTGILTSHSEFGGRATGGYTAIDDGRGTTDCHGHGTHVAGTVGGATYGVAKGVSLVAVRVLDCNGRGPNSGVIAGMDWIVGQHAAGAPAVANMSLGGGADQATDDAVQRMIADGVTTAVAAGNGDILGNPQNACNYSPARAPNAITVGSTTSTDARSSWSNYGTCLDLFAPGSSITSAGITSSTATATKSGTSMATPHVAGVAALYLSANTGAAPSAVRDAIVAAATPNKVGNPLTGSPNLLLYSAFVGGASEPPPTGNQAPTAGFSTSCSGLTCTFTSTSADPDGAVVGWSWDFGNGQTAGTEGPHPITFAQGQYTVTLTVTDDDGAISNTASKSLNCRKRGKNVSCQ